MPFRGRHWIAFWLVALLAALWAVIARQTSALNSARALTDLRAERHRWRGAAQIWTGACALRKAAACCCRAPASWDCVCPLIRRSF